MDKAAPILLVAVLLVPWIVVLFYYFTKKKRAQKYLAQLQKKYSLTAEELEKNKSVITGYYRSRPVRIESGVLNGQRKTNTLLKVGCPNPDNLEFILQKRNKANNLVYSHGVYKLDDNEFDKMFILQTNDIERLKALFDFNTRFKLQQIYGLGFKGEISLQGTTFTYNVQGLLNNDAALMKLELVMHELCDLADVMKNN